jgi:Lipocalin-like domain
MKISFFSLLSLGVLCALVFVNCNKKNNPQVSNMTLITQAAWKYDTAGIGDDSSGVIVAPPPPGVVKDCEKDNIFYFNTNGTGTEDEGATKCDSTSPQTVAFTWSFNGNQNAINSSDSLFAGIGGSISITSLTATQLHLSKVISVQNIPFIVEIYLKH